MAKQEYEKKTGQVIQALPNTEFMVIEDETQEEVRCMLNGKMKKFHIHVRVGDKVTYEEIPNSKVNRITYRES